MTVAIILKVKGRAVATAAAGSTVGDVCKTMAEKRIGAVVIVEDGDRVAGIVSERDIVRAIALRGGSVSDQSVSEIMTRTVVTVREGDRVHDVMRKMSDGKFRHLPVVTDGRLAGIISIGDVVKHRLDELESEAGALRDYILAS